jgi:hypothetical protein
MTVQLDVIQTRLSRKSQALLLQAFALIKRKPAQKSMVISTSGTARLLPRAQQRYALFMAGNCLQSG